MPDVHSQIDIRSLSLNIAGTQVLEDISLAVAQGEFVGVIGPNGAGKSSLLKAVYGFKYSRGAQIAGEVSVDGDSVGHYSRRALAQKIAVVLQEPIMPFELSVYDVIAMGLTPNKPLLSFITKDDRVEIMQAAEQVDLVHKLPQSFESLSGGEKQRALIARAIIQQPDILLLDEPTNHLDIRHQIEILDLVRQLKITSLVSIHDLNLAAAYCDRIVLLSEGKLVIDGTPEQVLTPEVIAEVFQVKAQVERVGANQLRVSYEMGGR
jgi:iron complex transport system ATP-binding protein